MNHARSAVRLAVATASIALAVSSLGWVPAASASATAAPQIGAIGALPMVKKVKTKIVKKSSLKVKSKKIKTSYPGSSITLLVIGKR